MYEQRNALLRKLFGQTYGEYLASALWARIRGEVLRRANYRCHLCHDRASQVHHARYTEQNLSGKSYKGLSAICKVCHKGIERAQDGGKLEPAAVGEVLAKCRSVDVNAASKQRRMKQALR